MLLEKLYWEAKDLLDPHIGHKIVITPYPGEISIECEDCKQVLVTFPEVV